LGPAWGTCGWYYGRKAPVHNAIFG